MKNFNISTNNIILCQSSQGMTIDGCFMSQGILPRASYHLGQLTIFFYNRQLKTQKKTLITRVGPIQWHDNYNSCIWNFEAIALFSFLQFSNGFFFNILTPQSNLLLYTYHTFLITIVYIVREMMYVCLCYPNLALPKLTISLLSPTDYMDMKKAN